MNNMNSNLSNKWNDKSYYSMFILYKKLIEGKKCIVATKEPKRKVQIFKLVNNCDLILTRIENSVLSLYKATLKDPICKT